MNPGGPPAVTGGCRRDVGAIVRTARQAQGLTLACLGERTGYSAAQVSRYERGIAPLTDVVVLRRFAAALAIPPHLFGLAPQPAEVRRHGTPNGATSRPPRSPAPTVTGGRWEDGEDPLRRRQLLANLAVTAAAVTAAPLTGFHAAVAEARFYTLATRMLIKLDDQQLGWMAADRARVLASTGDQPLAAAEAARNLAVLARKAGRYSQAMTIALQAADHPGLKGDDPKRRAERGLLLQSAAYTAARGGDRTRMRELTGHAAALAAGLDGRTLLRDHGGGFSPATVALHMISAEYSLGEAGAAINAARRIPPASLPTTERRTRYYTDLARAYGQAGRRSECLRALLLAERHAPEETHARPAIRDLISGLLVSGRTSPKLRGLALRCGLE
ncbi:MAG: hypothetical protein QOJ73_6932 [Streptosporangiaceae bacterium]|jgi:transcriptional regulator with XRE-family HTH domain|nr:hypothetical protein [Streptosporangiaceae bacterium]